MEQGTNLANMQHPSLFQRLLATTVGILVISGSSALAQSQPTSSATPALTPSSTSVDGASRSDTSQSEASPSGVAADKTNEPESGKSDADTVAPESSNTLQTSDDSQQPEDSSRIEAIDSDDALNEALPEPKRNRSKTRSPQPIEPFIEADAIAIGKWLVTQKLQALANNTLTPKPESTNVVTSGGAAADKTNGTQRNQAQASNTSTPSTNRTNASATSRPRANRPASTPPRQAPQQAVASAPNAPLPPAPSNNLTIDSALEMRVAVERDVPSISVAVSNGGAIVSLDGQLLKSLSPGNAYQAGSNGSLTINGESMPSAVWVQPDSGYVAVGDRWYRGRVLLQLRERGVIAVNYVMLNEYLYSVVGAEMSASWSIEALKAQAVAARSYALVHNVRPASRDYDLDDTQRYQAYKGVMTEANTTHAAVQSTAGEFVSHNGGIVESLYAATQDIVNNAHKGFGMSQTGALRLAEQGYQYHQILASYYPDTAVGRLDIGE